MTSDTHKPAITIKFSLLMVFLSVFGIPLLLSVPLFVLKAAGYSITDTLGLTADNFYYFVVYAQVVGLFAVLGITALRLKKRNAGWAELGLKKFSAAKAAKYIFGYYGILLVLLIAVVTIVALLHITPDNSGADTPSSVKTYLLFGGLIPNLIIAVVIAPFVEEIVFRGMLFGSLKKRTGVVAAILLSGVIFSLIHINPIAFISTLPLGIYAATMYHRTGSIIPGMILHASWNLLVTLLAAASA